MAKARPIKVTAANSNPDGNEPEPVVIVGGVPTGALPHASTTAYGTVKKTAAVADLDGGADLATTVAKVNALLAELRTAGIVSSS